VSGAVAMQSATEVDRAILRALQRGPREGLTFEAIGDAVLRSWIVGRAQVNDLLGGLVRDGVVVYDAGTKLYRLPTLGVS